MRACVIIFSQWNARKNTYFQEKINKAQKKLNFNKSKRQLAHYKKDTNRTSV